MADTETQLNEETKIDLDADAAIDAAIDASQVEHGGEGDEPGRTGDDGGVDSGNRQVDAKSDGEGVPDASDKTDASGGDVKREDGGAGKQTDDVTQQAGQDDKQLEAPVHWPSDDRELFTKQPKEVQQWMTSRIKSQDADYTRKTQEIAPLRNVIQKWDSYLTQTGQVADTTFDLLMSAEQRLRSGTAQDKVAVVQALAKDYNIPLEALAPPQGEQGALDEQQLMQQHVSQAIQPYQQQLQQMQDYEASKLELEQQAQYSTLQQEINTFADEKTEAGELAHPFYRDPGIEDTMAILAKQEQDSGQVPVLQDLYDRAVRANPATFAKLEKGWKANFEQEQKARVAKARNAGTSVVTGSGVAPSDEQPKGIDDILNSAFEEHANA